MEKFRQWLLNKNLQVMSYINMAIAVVMYLLGIFLIPETLLIAFLFWDLAFFYMSVNENKDLLMKKVSLAKILLAEFPFVCFNIIVIVSYIFNKYTNNIVFIIVLLIVARIVSLKINKIVRDNIKFQ